MKKNRLTFRNASIAISLLLLLTVSFSTVALADIPQTHEAAIYYKFTKASQTTDTTGAPVVKVTQDITGTGMFSTTESKTTSRALNISLSSSEEAPVYASVSGTVGKSASTQVGITVNKTRASKGYLAFQPYRAKVTGTLKTYNTAYANINGGLIQTRSVTAYYPKKLSSGYADGNYYVYYY